ncbi:MAG: hypothetical protein AMXMBFR64_22870 [Myxococcales bacterium]
MRRWTGALLAAGVLAATDVAADPTGSASAAADDFDDLDDEPELDDPLSWQIGTMLVLRPVALIQAQAAPYVGDDALVVTGDAADSEGFRLRRARLGFSGVAAAIVPFQVSGELAGDTARLVDAWVGVVPKPFVGLYAGARKVPFSRSAIMGADRTALIERPFAVRAMAPFRQVGMSLEGDILGPMLHYSVGLFNGFQRSDLFGEGYTENAAAFGNRFDELAVAGRLSTAPLGELGESMADLDHSSFRFGVGCSAFYSDGGTRDIIGVEGDFLIHSHGFHFLGEFLWDTAEPESKPTQGSTQLAKVERMSAVGELGYVVLPRMLSLSARVEWMDPNTGIDDNGDQVAISAGFAFHVWEDYAKVQAEFVHREELNGPSLDNDAMVIQVQLGL